MLDYIQMNFWSAYYTEKQYFSQKKLFKKIVHG